MRLHVQRDADLVGKKVEKGVRTLLSTRLAEEPRARKRQDQASVDRFNEKRSQAYER